MTDPDAIQTSLTEATAAMRDAMRNEYGAEVMDTADQAADELRKMDFAARTPKVGEGAPGFRLPDARGGMVELDQLLAERRVVLVFYRGSWCPYCNLQLAAFQTRLDEIEAAGASLVAVSPQTPDASLSFAEKQELRFAVLSDTGNEVARRYGLEYVNPEWHAALQRKYGLDITLNNGDDSQRLPAAATFVIARDGTIVYASVSADYRWRVGPEEVLEVLRR